MVRNNLSLKYKDILYRFMPSHSPNYIFCIELSNMTTDFIEWDLEKIETCKYKHKTEKDAEYTFGLDVDCAHFV